MSSPATMFKRLSGAYQVLDEGGVQITRARVVSWKAIIAAVAAVVVLVTAVTLVVLFLLSTSASVQPTPPPPPPPPTAPLKNVVFFVADGFGPASVTMARDAQGGVPLALDALLHGSVRTYPAGGGWVTDSAAGATAYASGVKTINGYVGVDANQVPVATLIEAARAKNYSTGIVCTSRVTHATPGAFSAHSVSRDAEFFIAGQQIFQGIDLILGGGRDMYRKRPDGRDLVLNATSLGYQYIQTGSQLRNMSALRLPLLGLFADSHMSYEIDRKNTDEPSLAEMTAAALSLLSAHATRHKHAGFFLLVEASRIDMAGHNNDPAGHLRDIQMYDKTMAATVSWATAAANTAIIATADHETGGLTLGYSGVTESADYNIYLNNILRVNMSSELMATRIRADTSLNISQFVLQETGIVLSADQLASIVQYRNNVYVSAAIIGRIESLPALLGWTTVGHTGVDVHLYTFATESILKASPGGVIENTALTPIIASALGLDLASITAKLATFNPHPPDELVRRSRQDRPLFGGLHS